MGIRKISINYIHKMIADNGFKLRNLQMCELGNQRDSDNYKGFKVSKKYFESLGVIHTSIDWNGEDGALPLDFNKPINIGQFDVVTNIGFSEHVENHYQCFQNIYDLTKIGGISIHLAPKEGNYKRHKCYRWYREAFFFQLAKKKHYEIVDIGIINPKGKTGFDCIRCTLKKRGEK